MDNETQKRLEGKGWKVGDAKEFLADIQDNLEPVRKLVEASGKVVKRWNYIGWGFNPDEREELQSALAAVTSWLEAQEGKDDEPVLPLTRRCPKCKRIFTEYGDPECPYCLCPVSHLVEESTHEQP